MFALLTMTRGAAGAASGVAVDSAGDAASPAAVEHSLHLTPASSIEELPNIRSSTAFSGDWSFLFDTGKSFP